MNIDADKDASLLTRAGKGDGEALEQLFGMHRKRLRRMVNLRMDARLHDRIDASDVVQEVTITLSDEFDDNSTSSNMSINFSSVTYCVEATQARSATSSKLSTQSILKSDENSIDSIKVYPNPVSETLFIKGYGLQDVQANIMLYNINGAVVRNIDLNSKYNGPTQEMNVSDLANGLYLLHITDSKGSVLKTKRIIVK